MKLRYERSTYDKFTRSRVRYEQYHANACSTYVYDFYFTDKRGPENPIITSSSVFYLDKYDRNAYVSTWMRMR